MRFLTKTHNIDMNAEESYWQNPQKPPYRF